MELRATTYEIIGRIAVVELNRPHRGIAWSRAWPGAWITARAETNPS